MFNEEVKLIQLLKVFNEQELTLEELTVLSMILQNATVSLHTLRKKKKLNQSTIDGLIQKGYIIGEKIDGHPIIHKKVIEMFEQFKSKGVTIVNNPEALTVFTPAQQTVKSKIESLAEQLLEIYPNLGYSKEGKPYQIKSNKQFTTNRLKVLFTEYPELSDKHNEIIQATKNYVNISLRGDRYILIKTLLNFIYDKDKGTSIKPLVEDVLTTGKKIVIEEKEGDRML